MTDIQRAALQAVLDTFLGCGLERLDHAELLELSEHFALCLTDAEAVGYRLGWAAAMQECRDYQAALKESQQLKRAH